MTYVCQCGKTFRRRYRWRDHCLVEHLGTFVIASVYRRRR